MVYEFILYTFEIKILCDLLKDNHKKFRVHESIALTYPFYGTKALLFPNFMKYMRLF